MILDNLLSESGVICNLDEAFEGLNPIHEAIYTPDLEGMVQINNEAIEMCSYIDEKSVQFDGIARLKSIMNESYDATVLQEGIVKSAVDKMVNLIKSMWQKVVAFFKNVGTFVAATVNLEKTLKDSKVKAHLENTNFSEFTYKGYTWKSPDVASKVNAKLTEMLAGCSKQIQGSVTDAGSETAKGNTDKIESDTDSSTGILLGVNSSTGKSKGQTLIMIDEDYGCNGNAEEIKGFSAVPVNNMISFCLNFKGNKTIKDFEKGANKAYSQLLKDAKSASADINKVKNETNKDNPKNAGVNVQNALRKAKDFMASYNMIIGKCVSCEKQKYSEFKSVLIKAMRYNPKNAKNSSEDESK